MPNQEPGQYQDLFLRDNFGDTGWQPVADSYVSASPDIIPWGQDTLTTQQLISQYNPPLLHKPLQNNQINNIYVRTTNAYNGATSGQVYLYYAPGNLLVNVNAWKSNRIVNANGTFGANVSATDINQIAPGDQPFQFNPPTSLGTHFCLLAQVSTQMHPNPLPTTNFSSWEDFVSWVRWNANISWHNVDIINTLPAQGYINNLVFQNLNPSTEFYGFNVTYSNMPQGSILRMWANPNATAGFQGFDTGAVTINDVNGKLGGGQYFPANYQTTINTTCQFPGAPVKPPPGVNISTGSMAYLSNAGALEYRKYRSFMYYPEELGVTREDHDLQTGGMFVQITTYSVGFNPTAQSNPFMVTRR